MVSVVDLASFAEDATAHPEFHQNLPPRARQVSLGSLVAPREGCRAAGNPGAYVERMILMPTVFDIQRFCGRNDGPEPARRGSSQGKGIVRPPAPLGCL